MVPTVMRCSLKLTKCSLKLTKCSLKLMKCHLHEREGDGEGVVAGCSLNMVCTQEAHVALQCFLQIPEGQGGLGRGRFFRFKGFRSLEVLGIFCPFKIFLGFQILFGVSGFS